MTNNEAKAIGLRAVAWKDWREMPGMLLRHREYDNFRLRIGDERETPGTLGDVGPLSRAGWTVGSDGEPTGALLTWAHLWPDFRDPATLGCLLALAREACENAGRDVEIDVGTRPSAVVLWAEHDAGTDFRSDGPLAELLVWLLETVTAMGAA